MDERVCRYFAGLCRFGSYSAAARELCITPQGLNLAIRRLEKELGAQLVDGRHGPIRPTSYGEAFLEYAEEEVARAEGLRARFAEIAERERKPVRVIGAIGIVSEGLRQWLGGFGDYAGGSYVEFMGELPDSICEEDLLEGDVDFAIVVDPKEAPERMRGIRLARDCHYLWVGRDDPLSERETLSVEDLEGRSIMTVGADYHAPCQLLDLVHERGVHAHVKFCSQMITVYEYALSGEGLGLTGRSHVEAIASSRLVGIPFPELPVSFSLYWRADRGLLEHERQFVEYMSRYRQSGI